MRQLSTLLLVFFFAISQADAQESRLYSEIQQAKKANVNFTNIAFQEVATDTTVLKNFHKDYTNVAVRIVPGKIEKLFPNPASNIVTVTCVFNNVSNASLVITDYFGNTYAEQNLTTSPQAVDFNTHNYPIGTYIVKLICNGQLTDLKTFVKQ